MSFAYPGGRRAAHRELSFRVGAGERVGFVGESGAGKSTIVRLLLRFYDPDEGVVRVGGHDLRELHPDDVYRGVAVVNQDTYLFHGSVEDNLRFGKPDASDGELEAAARAANAHEFISRLPQGYATVVGERGIKLSGGQRQRIAIARALLRDAPILILDEALSAVDAENEAVIQQALDRLMQGRNHPHLRAPAVERHRGGPHPGARPRDDRRDRRPCLADARGRRLFPADGRAGRGGGCGAARHADAGGQRRRRAEAARGPARGPAGRRCRRAVRAHRRDPPRAGSGLGRRVPRAVAPRRPVEGEALAGPGVRDRAGRGADRSGGGQRAGGGRGQARRALHPASDRPRGDRAAGGGAALAGIVVRARHGLPHAGGDAHRALPEARSARAGVPGAPAHRRSGGDGDARRGAGGVLLRTHRGALLRGGAGSGGGHRDAGVVRLADGAGPAPLPRGRGAEPLPRPAPPRRIGLSRARGVRRHERARGGHHPGTRGDRRVPAHRDPRRGVHRPHRAPHRAAASLLLRPDQADRDPGGGDRSRGAGGGGDRRAPDRERGPGRGDPADAHPARDVGVPAGVGDRAHRASTCRHPRRHAPALRGAQRGRGGAGRPRGGPPAETEGGRGRRRSAARASGGHARALRWERDAVRSRERRPALPGGCRGWWGDVPRSTPSGRCCHAAGGRRARPGAAPRSTGGGFRSFGGSRGRRRGAARPPGRLRERCSRASRRSGNRDPGGDVLVFREPPARARRGHVHRPGGTDGGAGRALGGGQDHHRPPADALLGPGLRGHPPRRTRSAGSTGSTTCASGSRW